MNYSTGASLNQPFPQTRWSAIVATASDREEERQRGFENIIRAYWKPVFSYIRIKWNKSSEDAKDLTQGFFLKAMEKDYFQQFDPGKSHFRTYVRVCLEGYLANENKAAKRMKRGGGAIFESLDFDRFDGELRAADPSPRNSPEEYFDHEWLRSFFAMAVEELQTALAAEGKQIYADIFERYDLAESPETARVSYESLAREFGISTSKVTNYLAVARRRFRQIILEKLRELTATEEEFRHEVQTLLGTFPR